MSQTKLSDSLKCRLWAKSGGLCEYRGCNEDLTGDGLTQAEFNAGYHAHVIGDRPGGPRGSEEDSARLANDLSNVMLLCDKHHRLIDRAQVKEHSVERLREMKREHEERIAFAVSIAPEMRTEILRYAANVGDQSPVLTYEEAKRAIFPNRYPSPRGIAMQMLGNTNLDSDPDFYKNEERHLVRSFDRDIYPRASEGSLQHLSVFAVAPQPLLIRIGMLLCDIHDSEVFQLHREPRGWSWPSESAPLDFRLEKVSHGEQAALIISLSATITPDRVSALLADASIWILSVEKPQNDLIKSREHLHSFRATVRHAFDRIKAEEGHGKTLHIYPAMPVSTAVEVGRVYMPKADMPLRIYDEVRGRGFIHALDV